MNIVDKILVDPITRGLKFFTKGGVPAYITQVRGRTDGSAAAAGEIGEVINATNAVPSVTVAGVYHTVTSVALTAGNWAVTGTVGLATGASTTWASNSFVSATISTVNNVGQNPEAFGQHGVGPGFTRTLTVTRILTLSSTTTIYLVSRNGIVTVGGAAYETTGGITILSAVRIA